MKEIGIYIHIPFCKHKCKYCDFVSFENSKFVKEYIDRLLWDIENIEEILIKNKTGAFPKDMVVDTIYIGGGTPSFIEPKYIAQILDLINKKFKVKENAEITIELNPGTVDKDKLEVYKNSGVNRLSIGCQETHDEILEKIGRIHRFKEFLDTYNLARNLGFKNINVDLMLALPNQTIIDLEESLEKIVNLEPEHISVYSLILEDNTPLKNEVENNILKLPSEDMERKMYYKTKEILEKNGYKHYEISNFAKLKFYSKHNMNCWNQHEYIGFGLASHSYLNKKRFSNCTNLPKYIEKSGEQVYNINVSVNEIQDKFDEMKEYIMLGLRKLDGIDKKDFFEKFNEDIDKVFSEEIEKLKSQLLIEDSNEFLKLSPKGLDFANIVFEEFV